MAKQGSFVVTESFGTYAFGGPPDFAIWEGFTKSNDEARFIKVSKDKSRMIVGNNASTIVYDCATGKQVCAVPHKMLLGDLSPKGSYIIQFDNFNQQTDNFRVWDVRNSEPKLAYGLKLTKPPEAQFSGDESHFARLSNNTLIFSQAPDFGVAKTKTPDTLKIASFSLSGGNAVHLLCYVPSSNSGTPSFARIYRYPEFGNFIASKSFFQADRVESKWNSRGTAALLITYTDIDKTGKSYYGKTMLHYLDIKGSSATVQTDTDAPIIHAAEWSPNGSEFCAITGKMPNTRAAIFNSKCEVILDMGISARNAIHFNRHGNLLLLGGFGNLAHGAIEMWEVAKLKKKVAQMQAPATTQLEWLDDGVHFVTATTAPRLNIDNGFKVWDFTGKQIYEWKPKKQMFGVYPLQSSTLPAFPEDKLAVIVKQLGNKVIPPREETKKAAAYVPPSLRKGNAGALAAKAPSQQQKPQQQIAAAAAPLSENEKKIKSVKKKLEQIQKLKEQQAQGKPLEINQLTKITSEAELLKELKDLQLGS